MIGALLALAACSPEPAPNHPPHPPRAAVSTGGSAGSCPAPVVGKEAWEHKRTTLLVQLGPAHHGAVDPIVLPGEPVSVRGKFAYGAVSKDLEDETVALLRSPSPVASGGCASWQSDGAARTNRDGRVEIPFDGSPTVAGRYPFSLVVAGDGSSATGAAWVLAASQRVVVFDIDGTLTTGDEVLFEQILSGESSAPRSGAVALASRLVQQGLLPVYMTGRPDVLAGLTRDWLDRYGFPPGPLRTTGTTQAAMPTDDGVQAFKLSTLEELLSKGVVIERAYGNAVTDICAYAQAGIPADRTFIVGRHGGKGCDGGAPTQALGDGYDAHLATLP